jgi:hypothetical protein
VREAYFSCGRIISKNCLIPLGKGTIPEENSVLDKSRILELIPKQVSAIVREFRNNMAPCDNIMTTELVKGGGRMLRRKVHTAC